MKQNSSFENNRNKRFAARLSAMAAALMPAAAFAITGTGAGGGKIYINDFVGADAFYDAGIRGQNVNVAVIEGGSADSDCLGYLQGNNFDYDMWAGDKLSEDPHASGTLGIMAGYVPDSLHPEITTGIAPEAKYVSVPLARAVNYGRFSFQDNRAVSLYEKYFTSGTDVISSSWGGGKEGQDVMLGAIFDDLASHNPATTFVSAAGNEGEQGPGNIYSPEKNRNVIAVGALSSESNFTAIAKYSNYGPNDFYNPVTKQTTKGALSSVDIVAPGTIDLSGDNDKPYEPISDSGTSFAAPVVSGVVALMKSYSKEKNMDAASRDSRLVKAVLLNSARKPDGWDNGQSLENGVKGSDGKTHDNVIFTSQSLDYHFGAGIVDGRETLGQYAEFGQTSFLDRVEKGSHVDYGFAATADSEFTATLSWFVGSEVGTINYFENEEDFYSYGMIDSIADDSYFLSNLDLELWKIDVYGEASELIAVSASEYNTVEHLSLMLEESGEYVLRVVFDDTVYGDAMSEEYAVAWNLGAAIPEPAHFAAIFCSVCLFFASAGKKSRRA